MSNASRVPGLTRGHLWLVLAALMAATFLASMEISIINTALPTIVGEFGAFESFAWVGTAYIATSAIGTPLWGKLSDLWGRRPVFLTTLAIFVGGSLWCGVAGSMGELIAARAAQGLGGGAIQALAFAILGDILPPRERGRYIGYFTLTFAGAAFAGPVIGGVLIDSVGWRWVFFVNVPLGAIVAAMAVVALKLPFPTRRSRLDWPGALLLSMAVAALMVGLELGQSGWGQSQVVGLLAFAAAATLGLVVVERLSAEPIIPPHLFANRAVVTATLLGVWASVVAYGAAPFLPLYFQDSMFVSPTESGLRVLPIMVGVVVGSFVVGRLISRYGRCRPWPILGSIVGVAGLASLSKVTGTTAYAGLVLPMVAVGFGMSAMYTTSSIIAQNAVDVRDLGAVTSTIMFFRALAGSVGLAIFGTVLNGTIRDQVPALTGVSRDAATDLIRSPQQIQALVADQRQAVVDSVASGVGRIYLFCTAVTVVALVTALAVPERPLRLRAGISDALEAASTADASPLEPI